ncbi:MAG: hypothetical protein WC025_01150 [Candidatus Magasanikbacteria bacterium]
MKLDFPPKKVQFWLLFAGFSFSILLLITGFWCNSVTRECNETFLFLFFGPVRLVRFFNLNTIPIQINAQLCMAIFLCTFYSFLFWFLGSILWMLFTAIKKKKHTD